MRPTISDPFRGATAILQSRHDASPELVVKGLQHRIRNLLSVVQCFVINTEAKTADDYRDALAARLATLSGAYNLIESARKYGVSLTKLLERALKPHALLSNDRILLAGPDIVLAPRSALSLHMIFHELATNASKHGALTVDVRSCRSDLGYPYRRQQPSYRRAVARARWARGDKTAA